MAERSCAIRYCRRRIRVEMSLRRRSLLAIFVGLAAVASPSTRAQGQRNVPPRTTGDQAVDVARKTFDASIEAQVADRRVSCMKAFGNLSFCNCLSAALPLEVNFQRYVTITTADSDTIRASDSDQRLTDVVLATRDRCVAAAFGAR